MKAKLQALVNRLKPKTVIAANPLLADRLRECFAKGDKVTTHSFNYDGKLMQSADGSTEFYAKSDIDAAGIDAIIHELRADTGTEDEGVLIQKRVLDELYWKAREHDSALLADASTNLTGVETDINHRWEHGIEHHPQVVALMAQLKAADQRFGGLAFDFKTGGDGDNGEHLMYLLDIIFEARESAKRNGPGLLEAKL